ALRAQGVLRADPIRAAVAAVSVGIVAGTPLLDLDYEEDSHADVDSNVVMTDAGSFIETQATAERAAYTRAQLDTLLALAERGIRELLDLQRANTPT
ncbi:MAG TPA: hypothetical protein VIG30_06130, partial [Ktedonobacterales bacterium]